MTLFTTYIYVYIYVVKFFFIIFYVTRKVAERAKELKRVKELLLNGGGKYDSLKVHTCIYIYVYTCM